MILVRSRTFALSGRSWKYGYVFVSNIQLKLCVHYGFVEECLIYIYIIYTHTFLFVYSIYVLYLGIKEKVHKMCTKEKGQNVII